MDTTLLAEIAARATPLSLDRDAPLDDLEPLADRVRDAKVAALGSAVRHSHELLTLSQRVMRWLVDRHGFRALSLEGDEAASHDLDAFVRAGEGDPRAILARARPFWRFGEILDAVRWIRSRNEQHPDDPVRIVHPADAPREATHQLAGGEDVERRLADALIAWHERTGQRIIHWGGLAHTANGRANGGNAGSHLRSRFGPGYVSIALTFHHIATPTPEHAPPADCIEALLGAVDLRAYLLDLRGPWPESVRGWLDAPAKARLIGPGVHELRGDSLRTWFDFIIHSRRVTPAGAL
jgi:erythromycin esterase